MENSMNTKRLLLILPLLPGSLLADPGPVGQWLMNNEVSLFSFGMYRLNNKLEQDASYMHLDIIGADYDWDANRIKIFAVDIKSKKNNPEAKERCRLIMNHIRQKAGINLNTGTYYNLKTISVEGSRYSSLFMPIGYTKKSAPDNLQLRLDKIFYINVGVALKNDEGKIADEVGCEGPLISKNILFGE